MKKSRRWKGESMVHSRPISADPYLSLRYRVEIDHVEYGGFSEVSGLQIEIETEDYREGGVNEYIHRLAGPAKFPSNLILKHGLFDDDALWKWIGSIRRGSADYRSISIVLLNSAGEEACRWDFRDVCPVRWSGPTLRGGSPEVAIEEIEFVHSGLLSTTHVGR